MQRFSLPLNQTPLVYTIKFFFALSCPQSSVQTAFWLASVIFSKLALGSDVGFWSAVTFLLWPCHPRHCCLVLRHTLGLVGIFVGRPLLWTRAVFLIWSLFQSESMESKHLLSVLHQVYEFLRYYLTSETCDIESFSIRISYIFH